MTSPGKGPLGLVVSLVAAAALALHPSEASAQRCVPPDCVLVNGSLLRVGVGATVLSLGELPNAVPARDGVGIFLRVGVPVASVIYTAVTHRARRAPGFTLYDDFYLEFTPTWLLSDALTLGRESEGRFGFQARVGWEFAAGWQFSRVGLWAGMRLQGERVSLGDTSQPGLNDILASTFPFLVRADFAVTPSWHVIAMPWVSAFGSFRSVGAELDVGLGGNFYIGLRVDHLYGGDVSLANSTAYSSPGGALTTGLIYFRSGREY